MAIISEKYHKSRLNRFNINIKTKFYDGHIIKENNTNEIINKDIKNAVILSKVYEKNEKVLHIQKEFNPGITYTYIIEDSLKKNECCPNCGYTGQNSDFVDGCPYCGTYYNIDYTDKKYGSKYNYNLILKNNLYLIYTFIIDMLCCLILSYMYIISTGRTFTIFDNLKAIGFGIILAFILYFPFYYFDALVILLPIKIKKKIENQKQIKFWNEMEKKGIVKEMFFNNLNFELQKYYYDDTIKENKNVIDYDILDYESYNYFIDSKNRIKIKVKVMLREIRTENEKVIPRVKEKIFTLIKNEIKEDKINNIVICHNCGASIDALENKCKYCGTKFNYLQSWYIVN